MRSITGWRFLVYIAVPLVLASLGAINMSYDLLRGVEQGSNAAEHQRNLMVLTQAIQNTEADLARLVMENAHWDEAVERTNTMSDQAWFERTWGSALSMGAVYDHVAVLDLKSGKLLWSQSKEHSGEQMEALLGDKPLSTYTDMLDLQNVRRGVVSGFVDTIHGPVAMAMAPVFSTAKAPDGNGRVLYLGKHLDNLWLEALQKKLLIGGIAIGRPHVANTPNLALKSPDGMNVFSLTWKDRLLGGLVTASSSSKVGLTLGFLVFVMAGIGFVCWKLVGQLLEDEGKAQHKALHDHLTGLPNRLSLTQSMQKLREVKLPYAIAFADLDGFKEVNDSYGHDIGDRLIYMIADGIRELSQTAVSSCRLGGDEFVVLFSGNTAQSDAIEFAENLIAMLKQPFDLDGRLASVGASVGIADCDGTREVSEILRRSDIAMYKAKAHGKNRLCIFDETFDAERNENMAIASELKSILSSRNLDIAFQPVVSARTAEITGLEALARWPSNSARKVSADRFIAVAENCGLIDQLGELILEKACFAAANWPDIRLAVNISAVQLNNPSFVQRSLAVIAKHGIPANRVEFEITETSLIHDTDRAKQVFKALQKAGIKVALDDFGTGFSSIGYLRTFQFDRIKIDKSIIGKVMSSAAELAVVQGTLLVARGLSADVTAEGIESAEQASVLRLAGCTELQGYLYHKPMSAAVVTETLRRNKVAYTARTQIVA
jgi:diguanylate cyclase (GGDEF)-like protein